MSPAVLQISGGPASRAYTEVFLRHGVALIVRHGGRRIQAGRLTLGLCLALVAWLAVTGCRERAASTQPPPAPVDAGAAVLPAADRPAAAPADPRPERLARPTRPGPVGPEVFQVPLEGSPVFGPASARVTAVLFADLADPASATWVELLDRLRRERPDEFRWVLKHYPSVAPGSTGLATALVGVLAAQRGRFEPYLRALLAEPGEIAEQRLIGLAGRVGLERAAVEAALASEETRRLVDADRRLAARLAVQRAPAVFVNGRRLELAPAQAIQVGLRGLVEQERGRAGALLAQGTPPEKLYQALTGSGRRSAWTRMTKPERPERFEGGQSPERGQTEWVEPGPGPRLGARQAPVQVVMFADLTCSFCRQMLPLLQRLQAAHPEAVGVAIRLLPDRRERPSWIDAAVMLQALADGDAFWTLAPRLIGAPEPAAGDWFPTLADLPGLDTGRLRQAVERPEPFRELLAANRREADRLGIRSSPTLFVNGRRIPGATGYETLERMVAEELATSDPPRSP